MEMTLKKQRDTPMQEAVLDRLRHLTRQYPAGSKLPTVRQLIADYEADINLLLDHLQPDNLPQAHELANWPDQVRGFGPVKATAIAHSHSQRATLRLQLSAARQTA